MHLLLLIDPPHLLKPYKDSSIAMLERALAMGWRCSWFTPKDLYVSHGIVHARLTDVSSIDINQDVWYQIGTPYQMAIHEANILLMRKDPPFDMGYIYLTYMLEMAEQKGLLVANRPQSLRDANEKFFTQYFTKVTPPTLVSQDMRQLRAFWQEHQSVIYKPLEGMGGSSVFHVDKEGQNLSVILEQLTKHEQLPIMAQKYIPDIKAKGDKRILLINGEPVPYALARIPRAGELRGNLAAGATGEVVPLNQRDYEIARELAPTLKAKGLYFVGIDVIGDYLTEINVTSPTCIREIEAVSHIDISGKLLTTLSELL